MKKLTKKKLASHLEQCDKEEIIKEVITLFDKFKNVKEFYANELSNEGSPLLDKYKKTIADAYAGANPSDRRTNTNLNKLLRDFKKISVFPSEQVELSIYRVECAMDAIDRNSRRTEAFYNAVINSFNEAIKVIRAKELGEEFSQRIATIVKNCPQGRFNLKQLITSTAL